MIERRDLTKRYPDDTVALDALSLSAPRGGFLVLLGRSRAGKSTLLRRIIRLVEPMSGEIAIDGARVDQMRRSRLRDLRRQVGMIFQDFHLVRRRRVLDNVLPRLRDLFCAPCRMRSGACCWWPSSALAPSPA